MHMRGFARVYVTQMRYLDAAKSGMRRGGGNNLKVNRKQFPLTPAGAQTVHCVQGETRHAVIVAGDDLLNAALSHKLLNWGDQAAFGVYLY